MVRTKRAQEIPTDKQRSQERLHPQLLTQGNGVTSANFYKVLIAKSRRASRDEDRRKELEDSRSFEGTMAKFEGWNSKSHGPGSTNPPTTPGKLRIYNMRFCPFAQRTVLALAAKVRPSTFVSALE